MIWNLLRSLLLLKCLVPLSGLPFFSRTSLAAVAEHFLGCPAVVRVPKSGSSVTHRVTEIHTFFELGVLCVAVLIISALAFGICVRVADSWNLPYLSFLVAVDWVCGPSGFSVSLSDLQGLGKPTLRACWEVRGARHFLVK